MLMESNQLDLGFFLAAFSNIILQLAKYLMELRFYLFFFTRVLIPYESLKIKIKTNLKNQIHLDLIY